MEASNHEISSSEGISHPNFVPREGQLKCGNLRSRLLQRVLDRMKANLATDLDLTRLAAESGYSRSHFLRTFRSAMGCSPHQCLIHLRVEQAKIMLRDRSIALIDIALDCGFSSHGHFSTTFRQIVGLTPSEYRRAYRISLSQGGAFSEAIPSGSPYSKVRREENDEPADYGRRGEEAVRAGGSPNHAD